MNRLNISLLSLLALSVTSRAAVVSYTSQLFTNATDVSTNGTLVKAVNLGKGGGTGTNNGPATTVVVINGVTFSSDSGTGTSDFADSAGDYYYDNYTGTGVITGVPDVDANAMLDSIEFGPGIGNSLATLTNLTIGQAYELQIIDLRATPAAGGSMSYGYAATVGGTEVYDLTGLVRSAPRITTGTFIADAVSQEIHVATTYANGNNLEVAAFQLRAVPEPSSAALLGLGGLALLLRRRK